MNFFAQFSEYLRQYDWGHFLFLARIISGSISAVLAVVIAVIVKKLYAYSVPSKKIEEQPAAPRKRPTPMKQPWENILAKLHSENPSDWNLAVIQADALVDDILKDMGLLGETMGERMRHLDSSQLMSVNDLWEAHRIRNQIAHEADRTATQHLAVRAISLYEKVLKEMEYLE